MQVIGILLTRQLRSAYGLTV